MRITDGNQQIVLSTREGQAIRFKEEEVRPMGRDTSGVNGMELETSTVKEGKTVTLVSDEVVSMATVREDETLLTVSELGFGKRTRRRRISAHPSRRQGRHHDERDRQDRQGGERAPGRLDDQVVLITDGGKVIRLDGKAPCAITGRNAQGVRLVKLDRASTSARSRDWRSPRTTRTAARMVRTAVTARRTKSNSLSGPYVVIDVDEGVGYIGSAGSRRRDEGTGA